MWNLSRRVIVKIGHCGLRENPLTLESPVPSVGAYEDYQPRNVFPANIN